MQAVEALTRLIGMADARFIQDADQIEETLEAGGPEAEQIQQDKIAIAIIQSMLNTALPVARFRCFVRIESGRAKGREYTLCAVRIEDIVAALYPLTKIKQDVYVLLFEQRATGADALDGYQGTTKSVAKVTSFMIYLESLRKYAELVN